jgi:hypothetical protein
VEPLDLAALMEKFIAQLHDHGFKVTTAPANSRHDYEACQKPTTHRIPLLTRAIIVTTPTRLHVNRLVLRTGMKNRAHSGRLPHTLRTRFNEVRFRSRASSRRRDLNAHQSAHW